MSEQPTVTHETNGTTTFKLPIAVIAKLTGYVITAALGAGGMAALRGVSPTPQMAMPVEMTQLLQDMALSKADREVLHKTDDGIVSRLEVRIDKLEDKVDAQTKLIMDLIQRLPGARPGVGMGMTP